MELLYLHAVCVLLGLPLPNSAPPRPQLSGPWEIGWDVPLIHQESCQIKQKGDQLVFRIQSNGNQLDFSNRQLGSACLLRDVVGDFSMRVRVDISKPAGKNGLNQAGLILTDGSNIVKIMRSAAPDGFVEDDGTPPAPLFVEWIAPCGSVLYYSYKAKTESPIFLHLERRGRNLNMAYSDDKIKWARLRSPFGSNGQLKLPQSLKIGVMADSSSAGVFQPSFDSFQLEVFEAEK